ncbi:MAG: S4 domain-containing protein, partial [Oligoflexia bacterium]|nr:S4 domain-containing protein [Oligoflexia bacterium]
MESFKEVLITEEFRNLRLDVFLTQEAFVSSRSKALKLISSQAVFLKGKALRASYRLNKGDLLKIFLPHEEKKEILSPYDYPVEIIFEDEELLVVNKPAGLV